MAKDKTSKADFFRKKQKKALDNLIDQSESFLGKLKEKKTPKTPEEIEALKRKKSQIEAQRKRKLTFAGSAIVGLVLIIIFGVHWLFQPTRGTVRYGACRNFLELYVQYPDYLRLASAREFLEGDQAVVRIWYSRLDGFGQYNMERMQCYFKMTEKGALNLSKVMIDQRELEAVEIESFNAALPAVLAADTDLSYPLDFADNIADLKFEVDALRRPLFGRSRR